jgi:hypothetical protein
MSKTLSWAAATVVARPLSATTLQLLAALLRAASEMLDRVAARQSARQAARALPEGFVEFHSLHGDAGAPEGALYVDGKLVGLIQGVKKL